MATQTRAACLMRWLEQKETRAPWVKDWAGVFALCLAGKPKKMLFARQPQDVRNNYRTMSFERAVHSKHIVQPLVLTFPRCVVVQHSKPLLLTIGALPLRLLGRLQGWEAKQLLRILSGFSWSPTAASSTALGLWWPTSDA